MLLTRINLLICLLVAVGCASTAVDQTSIPIMAEVVAEPEGAMVRYRGESVGRSPLSVPVESLADVLEIDAEQEGVDLVEKRVRIVSDDMIEVVFRFGDEGSAMAEALGLARVLIFDYSDRTTFEVDQWDLNPDFFDQLEQQAVILNTTFADLDVYVCGHTDNTGGHEHNLELSLRRAQAVTEFLVAHDVDPRRLKSQGFGEDYPLAGNDADTGRAINRRTEIVLPQ